MTQASLKPLQIFRPGRHTPMKGGAVEFTEAHLRRACEVYDPALHRAPFVVGHPKTDDPAFGHVDALAYSDKLQRVIASPAEVDAAFAEWVASGKLLSVSAAWYTPDAPNNPTPGNYYLRHVGFLGAQPPAVKGLERPAVAFSDTEEGVVEFGDLAGEEVAGLFGRLRDWLISTLGLEKADQVLPSWSIDSLKREAMQPESTAPAAAGLSYSEPGATTVTTKTEAQLQAEAAELQRERDALTARDNLLKARETKAHRDDMAAFADSLVKEGRLLPAERSGLVELMASLPAAGVELEFAEGDGQVKKPPLQVLQGFLRALPPRVDFSERAGKTVKTGAEGVDTEDGAAIAKAALEFQEAEAKAGRTVSLEAAVQHVMDTNEEA